MDHHSVSLADGKIPLSRTSLDDRNHHFNDGILNQQQHSHHHPPYYYQGQNHEPKEHLGPNTQSHRDHGQKMEQEMTPASKRSESMVSPPESAAQSSSSSPGMVINNSRGEKHVKKYGSNGQATSNLHPDPQYVHHHHQDSPPEKRVVISSPSSSVSHDMAIIPSDENGSSSLRKFYPTSNPHHVAKMMERGSQSSESVRAVSPNNISVVLVQWTPNPAIRIAWDFDSSLYGVNLHTKTIPKKLEAFRITYHPINSK